MSIQDYQTRRVEAAVRRVIGELISSPLSLNGIDAEREAEQRAQSTLRMHERWASVAQGSKLDVLFAYRAEMPAGVILKCCAIAARDTASAIHGLLAEGDEAYDRERAAQRADVLAHPAPFGMDEDDDE